MTVLYVVIRFDPGANVQDSDIDGSEPGLLKENSFRGGLENI